LNVAFVRFCVTHDVVQFVGVSVWHSPWSFVGFVPSVILTWPLAFWGALFLPERDFDLAHSLLGASLLFERSYLRFHDFDLAPSLLRASFHSERSYLHFCDLT
jgi:hypothetical protein